ncbi:MAG: GTP pyrophosphokinase [Clostridia bacterium]|nr:GTP pyrophosphokinase [Clostridia bacterium]
MIYTDKTKAALKLCFEAHKDQLDKSGIPYVFHPFHLAEQMTDEVTTVVALLHDVIEDTDYTFEDLTKMGFGGEIIDALRLLTHNDDTPYLEYVARIKPNPIARAVKLADLRHNSDVTRMDTINEWYIAKTEKYREAIKLLEG